MREFESGTADRSDFLLSDSQREELYRHVISEDGGEKQSSEISERAEGLDVRLRYLLEDVFLLDTAGFIQTEELREELDEIAPMIRHRGDGEWILREIEDGKASPFGVAIGQLLCDLYPGGEDEQVRLLWGLVLGYFGFWGQPNRALVSSPEWESPGGGIPYADPQEVLSEVGRRFDSINSDGGLERMAASNVTRSAILGFGQEMLGGLPESDEIEGVRDLPPLAQAIVGAVIRGPSLLRGLEETLAVRMAEADASSYSEYVDFVRNRPIFESDDDVGYAEEIVDVEVLRVVHELCLELDEDLKVVSEVKPNGVELKPIIRLLFERGQLTPRELNSVLGGGLENIKHALDKLCGEKAFLLESGWGVEPPVEESGGRYDLSVYGWWLGYVCFGPERPFSKLYALAFSDEVRELVGVHEWGLVEIWNLLFEEPVVN